MIKYVDELIAFSEVPNEVSLCINISNCPIHCPECHSKYLWRNVGKDLTQKELKSLIEKNKGITCVCIMGGDGNIGDLNKKAKLIKSCGLKCAFYLGSDAIPAGLNLHNVDFLKIGGFDSKYGPLNKETTNQRLFMIDKKEKEKTCVLWDVTRAFWDFEFRDNALNHKYLAMQNVLAGKV